MEKISLEMKGLLILITSIIVLYQGFLSSLKIIRKFKKEILRAVKIIKLNYTI